MDPESSRYQPPPLPPSRQVGNPYGAPVSEPIPTKSVPKKKMGVKSVRQVETVEDTYASSGSLISGLWRSRIGLRAVEQFCQRTGMGIRSGIDILRILETEKRVGTKAFRQAVENLQTRIKSGETMAEAMGNSNGYFPVLLVQMVHAGELAGGLDRIFAHMAEYYHELRLARNQFWSQLTWPLIQLGIALGVISLMIALQGMLATGPAEYQFDALGLGLKGGSGVLIFWSWVGIVLGCILVIVQLIRSNFLQCHRWMMPFVLKVPVVGSVFNNTALARLSMTLSMLLNSGVDAIRCVKQSFLSTGIDYYIQGMPAAVSSVERGDTLAMSFEASKVVPMEFIQGVEVGELSGNETESLEHLASEYQRRAKSSLTQLSYIASTTTWVLIAGIIIFFIFRIALRYLGMFNSVLQM